MRETRLERFLRSEGIKPAHLARESGYSRQHLLRLRKGQMEPTRVCIAALTGACSRLTGRRVAAEELFALEEESVLILLIDDDEEVRTGIAALLEIEGWQVAQAWNLHTAMAAVARQLPDAIIADIDLGREDGRSVYREIVSRFSTVPVVFISGRVPGSDLENLLGRPGAAFIEKPFAVEHLLSLVHAVTGR